jgi:hypothetical protein
MAGRKFSPFPILKQPKFPVYEALYKLNLAFQSLALEIEHLDDSEAIPLATLRLYRATAEDLRASINHTLTGVLHIREANDWYKYGKLKTQTETRGKR